MVELLIKSNARIQTLKSYPFIGHSTKVSITVKTIVSVYLIIFQCDLIKGFHYTLNTYPKRFVVPTLDGNTTGFHQTSTVTFTSVSECQAPGGEKPFYVGGEPKRHQERGWETSGVREGWGGQWSPRGHTEVQSGYPRRHTWSSFGGPEGPRRGPSGREFATGKVSKDLGREDTDVRFPSFLKEMK